MGSNGTATIGITDHAQNELGDLVHLETIKSGETLGSGDSFCTLESVKGVADAYAPVEAQVTEVNEAAVEEPAKINEDAENCWIVKVDIKNGDGLAQLMNKDAYEAFLESN